MTEGPIDPALTGKSTLLSPTFTVAEFAVIDVPRECAGGDEPGERAWRHRRLCSAKS
jgi:hypothetical protein